MATTGDVELTILDGTAGVVIVPSSQVQVVIGCATSGPVGLIVATRSLTTLTTTFTNGPLCEAAGLTIQAGGTVLAMRCTTAVAGVIVGASQVVPAVTTASTTSPIVITSPAHGLVTGDVVTIGGVAGQTGANGTFPIVVLTSSTFSLTGSATVSAYVSGGTIAFTGSVQTGTGTSAITYTGVPLDDYNLMTQIVTGGTVGSAGVTIKISLDAGRNFGPTISLGTAISYAIPGTGLTVNFATSKTLVATDYARCSTIAPAWNNAGLTIALAALASSPYAQTGWGSIHIVGVAASADATAVQTSGSTSLDSMATGHIYTAAIMSWRDASPPTAWGGTGETEAAWMTAILADTVATSCKRISAAAGYYNMPSAFPTAVASTPRYRRPLAWAYAARQVTIPAQRHAGRVKDGALAQILMDPSRDPADGFIYHDERITPALDFVTGGAGRFTSARTRVGLGSSGGFFIVNPLMLSPFGSDFIAIYSRLVMDVACTIAHQIGQSVVNDDLRTNQNGTLSDADARAIKSAMTAALGAAMTAVAMVSAVKVSVDQTQNILITKTVLMTVAILGKAYALEEDIMLGFTNALAA